MRAAIVVVVVAAAAACMLLLLLLGPSYTIPDCLRIGLLFVSDRGFIYTTTQ